MNVLKNMKIGMRLGLGFGLVLIIMIATALTAITNLKNVMEATHRITEDRWPKTMMANTIKENINVNARAIRNAILVDSVEDMKTELGRVSEAKKGVSGELEKLDKAVKGDREREALKRVVDARANYSIDQDKLISLIESGKKAEATSLMFTDFRHAQGAYFDAVDNLNKFESSLMEEDSRQSDSIYTGARNLLIGLAVLALLLTSGISFLIARGITRPLIEAVGSANKIAAGDLNFNIKADGRDETGQLLSAMGNMAGKIRGLAVDVNMLSDAAVEGKLDIRADAAKYKGEFRKILEGVNNTIGSLVGLIDSMPLPAMIIDKEFSIRYMNQTGANLLNTSQKQLAGNKCYDYFKTADCHTDNCACAQAMKRSTEATRETDAHPMGLDLDIQYSGRPIKDRQGNVIGAFEVVVDQTAVKKAARKVQKIADFQATEVVKLTAGLSKLAHGDLNVNIEVAGADADTAQAQQSFEEIAKAVNECAGNLTRIAAQTKDAANQVSTAADQIANANQNFSQKITEQAASVEETSSTMEEMSASIRQTAENAREANKLAQNTRTVTESGSAVMSDTIKAMDGINKSSAKIANISNVIEEIAFQTNLLALNAAVEAARAGEHGKGFAVVASEIRNLAQRASQSAKEITSLIEDSAEKTGRGVQLAQELSGKLGEIGTSIKKVTDLMDEVAAAAGEQASGTNQVNAAMSQIDQATQQNASLVEETASAAEELAAEAKELLNVVAFFKVDEGAGYQETKGRAAARELQATRKNVRQPLAKAAPKEATKIFRGAPELAGMTSAGAASVKDEKGNGGFEEF